MPAAIIAGLPLEIDRRIQSALKHGSHFAPDWQIQWIRSNSRMPGLAPSQLDGAAQAASNLGGAHLLIFRGRERQEETLANDKLGRYFRLRWLDRLLLKLIPHQIDEFLQHIESVLVEEIEWIKTVKPTDESRCLLLPECAFSAAADVRHLWTAATEPGIERIRLAARVSERFATTHWRGPRAWIDSDGRVFDHRGARHGVAPFPRAWKFSYQVPTGFHFDVTSRDSRGVSLRAFDGHRHSVSSSGHINIDPHGYVRR